MWDGLIALLHGNPGYVKFGIGVQAGNSKSTRHDAKALINVCWACLATKSTQKP